MSKSLYSEFPTNAHALGYGMHKLHLLKEACEAALHGDRQKVSKLIAACKKAAESAIEAGEKVDQEEGAE